MEGLGPKPCQQDHPTSSPNLNHLTKLLSLYTHNELFQGGTEVTLTKIG